VRAEQKARYEKFLVSKQADLCLAIALQDFFDPDTEETCRVAYEAYLRRRMLPAVTALIAADDAEKIVALEALGWFEAQHVERFIAQARKEKKTAALVWLLRLKQEKYGYHDKDFSL